MGGRDDGKMPYLAMDTATGTLTVAVGEAGVLLGEATTNLKRNHSNRLMPLIDALLSDIGIQPEDLKGIIVGHGPGSYTGVRIGVTTAKMMAWALNIPLLGVSSLDGLAGNFRTSEGIVCPMFDARRKQVYTALYERVGTDFRKAHADVLLPLDRLFAAIGDLQEERRRMRQADVVLFCGDGAQAYEQEIRDAFGGEARFVEGASLDLVRAGHLLDIGIPRLLAGERAEVEGFAPEYLQLAEAEAKWLLRQREQAAAREQAVADKGS
jgi:tRNA threonylcarbamoyladenosine biosynthesis protein TsaB